MQNGIPKPKKGKEKGSLCYTITSAPFKTCQGNVREKVQKVKKVSK